MTEPLKLQFPSQGWKQILTERKAMLDAYDKAREQARSRPVQTYHGNVAEGKFREWLTGFLPKRFGVTSGFIVSPGLGGALKIPHFDVIIYDALESPILWIEDNPDTSAQGRSLAIPVEHVRAVLEVKSHFNAANVKEAIKHLRELTEVLRGVNASDEQYKLYLPRNFRCGMVFFELRLEDAGSRTALPAVNDGIDLRGYFGGIILRGDSHTLPHSGRISLTQSDKPTTNSLRNTSLLEIGFSDTMQVADKVHVGAMLQWSEAGFAQFAFDLLAMMHGTYRPGLRSSAYGMGSSLAELIQEELVATAITPE